jgi:hypothetical protein
MFHGNIITSIKRKWSVVIKDSINSFHRVLLQDDPTMSDQQIEHEKKEILRQILSLAAQHPNSAPDLQPHPLELI